MFRDLLRDNHGVHNLTVSDYYFVSPNQDIPGKYVVPIIIVIILFWVQFGAETGTAQYQYHVWPNLKTVCYILISTRHKTWNKCVILILAEGHEKITKFRPKLLCQSSVIYTVCFLLKHETIPAFIFSYRLITLYVPLRPISHAQKISQFST